LKEKRMPIFEYVCADCGTPFEELVMSTNKIVDVTCPSCHGQNINKKISTFASKFAGGSTFSFGSASGSSCSTGSV
jgi:putative FmdB family regulatory protein